VESVGPWKENDSSSACGEYRQHFDVITPTPTQPNKRMQSIGVENNLSCVLTRETLLSSKRQKPCLKEVLNKPARRRDGVWSGMLDFNLCCVILFFLFF
jgi:hypothetical protein